MLTENVDSPVIFWKTGKVKSSLQTFLDSQDESLRNNMYTVCVFWWSLLELHILSRLTYKCNPNANVVVTKVIYCLNISVAT